MLCYVRYMICDSVHILCSAYFLLHILLYIGDMYFVTFYVLYIFSEEVWQEKERSREHNGHRRAQLQKTLFDMIALYICTVYLTDLLLFFLISLQKFQPLKMKNFLKSRFFISFLFESLSFYSNTCFLIIELRKVIKQNIELFLEEKCKQIIWHWPRLGLG